MDQVGSLWEEGLLVRIPMVEQQPDMNGMKTPQMSDQTIPKCETADFRTLFPDVASLALTSIALVLHTQYRVLQPACACKHTGSGQKPTGGHAAGGTCRPHDGSR